MACRSCGGRQARPDPLRGIHGFWSIRWPHGALQRFNSKAEAEAFIATKPNKQFVHLEPADNNALEI